MLLVYLRGCPRCGGRISDDRLAQGGVCDRCLPTLPDSLTPSTLCTHLPSPGNLAPVCEALSRSEAFTAFFQRATGMDPLPLQRTWTRRFFLGQSLALAAPPGMGKTTWGLVLSLFLPGKTLILVPTRLLGEQIRDRLQALQQRARTSRTILLYTPHKQAQEALKTGTFEILIGTLQFFHRRFQDLRDFSFSCILIDDVDAFLRRGRGVERLVQLMGFPSWAVQLARNPQISEKDRQRLEALRARQTTRVVMSSATLRPRPQTLRLMENLLGLDVQASASTLRNVLDARVPLTDTSPWELISRVVNRLGGGGLLYVSELLGVSGVDEAVVALRRFGFRVISYREHTPGDLLRKLQEEPFDLAVGLAHPTNPLVRGVDLPETFRYALFLEAPVRRIPLRAEPHPARLFALLRLLYPVLREPDRLRAQQALRALREWMGIPHLSSRQEQELQDLARWGMQLLQDPHLKARLRERPDVAVEIHDHGEAEAFIGDATTYIQATGRVSRLLRGGVTRGFSLVMYRNLRAMHSLERRLRFHLPHPITFEDLETVDLDTLRREMDESRRRQTGDLRLTTTLVVVESPTKARTIASFFGRAQSRQVRGVRVYEIPTEDRYLILAASLGHVVDLAPHPGFFGVERGGSEGFLPFYDTLKRCLNGRGQAVDPEEARRKCPEGYRDQYDLLEGLRHLALEVNEVLIATDPDAEGEKIALDLARWIQPYHDRPVRRMEFHEITPRAFREALRNPREIHLPRVKAQLARRILDRWVGFTLSRKLWEVLGPGLSAGRVQTPVLGWVIERSEAARRRVIEVRWKVGHHPFTHRFDEREQGEAFARDLQEGRVAVQLQDLREEERMPPPPLTTDRVLVEASRKLGMGAQTTMELLQELFERGLITYHRTDSTFVSTWGRFQVARPYITERLDPSLFVPRAWGTEGTHEAIRPTRPMDEDDLRDLVLTGGIPLRDADRSLALYGLIFRTFLASQMAPARWKIGTLRVRTPTAEVRTDVPVALVFPGFHRILPPPPTLDPATLEIREVQTREVPAALPFTQGELVAQMKARGLGRPSTYATIIQTLLERRYVVERRGRLWATPLGRNVYTFLQRHYAPYVQESLTRRLEEAMEAIEKGERTLREVLEEVYPIRNLLQTDAS